MHTSLLILLITGVVQMAAIPNPGETLYQYGQPIPSPPLISQTQQESRQTPVPGLKTVCQIKPGGSRKIVPLNDRIIFGAHIFGKTTYNVDTPKKWLSQPPNKPALKPGSGYGEFAAVDQIEGIAKKALIMEKAKQAKAANGFFLLTLQPDKGVQEMTDMAIEKIVNTLAEINAMDIPIMLRPMHEMNGSWYPWGQKPIQYKNAWIRLANRVRCKAPQTALVWSPNVQTGYPFGSERKANTEELKTLDTNQDGVVNEKDDPFAPYYPGHEHVDWIGLTLYYLGPYPFGRNQVPPKNFIADGLKPIMRFVNSELCRGGPSLPPKPFGVFETGAAFYPKTTDQKFDRSTGLLGEMMNVDIKISWLKQLTSSQMRKLGVALVMWFEFAKDESVDGVIMERDFALSRNQTVLQATNDILSVSLTTMAR